MATSEAAGDDHSHHNKHKWSLPFLKLWKKKYRRPNPPMPKTYGRFHNFFACFMRKRKKQKDERVVGEFLVQCPYNISSSTDFETSALQDGGAILTKSHHIRHLTRRSNSSGNKSLFENRQGAGPSQCAPESIGQSSMPQEAPLMQGRSRMLPHSEITEEEEAPLQYYRPRMLPHSEITEEVNAITEEEEAPLRRHPRMLPHSEITEEDDLPLRRMLSQSEITEEYHTSFRAFNPRYLWKYRSDDSD